METCNALRLAPKSARVIRRWLNSRLDFFLQLRLRICMHLNYAVCMQLQVLAAIMSSSLRALSTLAYLIAAKGIGQKQLPHSCHVSCAHNSRAAAAA